MSSPDHPSSSGWPTPGDAQPAHAYAFVAAALDRAEHVRNDPDRLATLWPDARVLVLDAEGRALADGDGNPAPSLGRELPGMVADAAFLGLDGDAGWFALASAHAADAPTVDLRAAAAAWPAAASTAYAQARALLHWQSRHRYCGRCGSALGLERAGWLGRCSGCGLEHYPRTDPAVIVAVSDGERLLLGRQASWPARRYSVLAGFVEPGETLEQTVVREVFEESQVRVHACRYLAAQPWPFPSSLMLGFVADAAPDPPRPNEELEDVRWFDRAAIGRALAGDDGELLLSPAISISRWLIERWHAGGR